MDIKKYYGPDGHYLHEHKSYLTSSRTNKDVNFLIKALKFSKKDSIIDLACGDGRHIVNLNKKGYEVEGVDFSKHLLQIAKERSVSNDLSISFYHQDIHRLKLNKRYSKAYMFFSEFGIFDPEKVLKRINSILKSNALFLLDTDNVFRLFTKLSSTFSKKYLFNFEKMELKEKGDTSFSVRYYVPTELVILFEKFGFSVVKIIGSYDFKPLSVKSKRLIFVVRKIK